MSPELSEKTVNIENVLDEVSRIKSVANEAVDEGMRSARRAIKRGRNAAGDAMEEVQHTIKQKPLQAVGVVFAVGVLAGILAGSFATWFGLRRR